MVKFDRFVLKNGLRVLVHEDVTTPMATVNVLYDVGARDEDPGQTGFAHLFEHLMFGGSINIPQYDTPLQLVGGENNAFTTNDLTNYYLTLPAANLETAFWLESDRMLSLAFNEKSLEVQRNVVCEEFKQRYLNQPYGDAWLKLRPMAYQEHPYRWATIGKELSHIENATIEDVKRFFAKHYSPQNAILVVAGNVKSAEIERMANKWFGSIPGGEKYHRHLPVEPLQTVERRQTVAADVPTNNLIIAFHMGGRLDPSYYAADLLSDILSKGQSSRLYRRLLKDRELFSEINAHVIGSIDPGLFVVEGKPLPGVELERAEEAIWEELWQLQKHDVLDYELEKVKNKIESMMEFAEMSILDKAMNLAYYELLGDVNQINTETERYLDITLEDIKRESQQLFRKENSSTLIYTPTKHA